MSSNFCVHALIAWCQQLTCPLHLCMLGRSGWSSAEGWALWFLSQGWLSVWELYIVQEVPLFGSAGM